MITEQLRERAYYRSQSRGGNGQSAEDHWIDARNEMVEERVKRRLKSWNHNTPERAKALREIFWMEEHQLVGWMEWVEKHHHRTYLAIEAVEDPRRLDIHIRQQIDQQLQTTAISDLLLVVFVLDGSAEYSRHLWRLHAGASAVSELIERKDSKFVRFAQQAIREMGGRRLDSDARESAESTLKVRRFQDGCVASFGIQSDQAIVDALRCAARLRRDLTYCNQSRALGWQEQLHMRAAIATSATALGVTLSTARQNEIALEWKLVGEVASKHPELMKFLVDDGLRLVPEGYRTRSTARAMVSVGDASKE